MGRAVSQRRDGPPLQGEMHGDASIISLPLSSLVQPNNKVFSNFLLKEPKRLLNEVPPSTDSKFEQFLVLKKSRGPTLFDGALTGRTSRH
jgi:hypothetical protein